MLNTKHIGRQLLPAACLALLTMLLHAPEARADFAVLSSGARLEITGWQRLGDTVRLDLPGGNVTLQAADLVSIEPQEIFLGVKQALEDSGPYAKEIRAAATAYGVDAQLIYSVIAVESNFNPRAVSAKLAYGLMQLRPETAARLAVRDIFDPRQNINAGTRYLKEQLDRFGQDLTLALAAYNAGPERVSQYNGVPPYRETRDYIRRVGAKLQTQKASTSGNHSVIRD